MQNATDILLRLVGLMFGSLLVVLIAIKFGESHGWHNPWRYGSLAYTLCAVPAGVSFLLLTTLGQGSPEERVFSVVAGMLLRLGVPILVGIAVQRSSERWIEDGQRLMWVWIIPIYFVTLGLEMLLVATRPDALQAAKRANTRDGQ